MIKRILIILLAVCMLFVLTSCKGGKTEYDGIPMREDSDVEYSDSTRSYAQNILERLLTYYSEKTLVKITPENAAKIKKGAGEIESIICNANLPEADYLRFFGQIEDNLSKYGNLFIALFNNSFSKDYMPFAKEALHNAVSCFGSENLFRTLYELELYRYDSSINNNRKLAEDNADVRSLSEFYQKHAEEAENQKRILENIGSEKFVSVTKTIAVFSDLFGNSDGTQTLLRTFSDKEITTLLKAPDISVSLTEEEWLFLMHRCKLLGGEVKEFITLAEECGDDVLIVRKAELLSELLVLVQADIDEVAVSTLKNADLGTFIKEIYTSFDETEKTLLYDVFDLRLADERYKTVILGSDRLKEYFDVEIKSVGDLGTCSPSDSYDVLRGIIKGIFYAEA